MPIELTRLPTRNDENRIIAELLSVTLVGSLADCVKLDNSCKLHLIIASLTCTVYMSCFGLNNQSMNHKSMSHFDNARLQCFIFNCSFLKSDLLEIFEKL